eukprot:2504876-Rhodomonas_salina.1
MPHRADRRGSKRRRTLSTCGTCLHQRRSTPLSPYARATERPVLIPDIFVPGSKGAATRYTARSALCAAKSNAICNLCRHACKPAIFASVTTRRLSGWVFAVEIYAWILNQMAMVCAGAWGGCWRRGGCVRRVSVTEEGRW